MDVLLMDRKMIKALAGGYRVPYGTVEKDYALTSLLSRIAEFPKLDRMVFKGGTAIKKSHYEDFRFSEDLDFSCLEDISDDFVGFIEDNMKGLDVEFTEVRGFEKKGKSAAFKVRYRQTDAWSTNLKIDLSMREDAAAGHLARPVLHSYEGLGAFSVPAMPVGEIMAEKIRALAYSKHPRHLHDVWFLHRRGVGIDAGMVRAKTASAYGEAFDLGRLLERLPEKAKRWTQDLRRFVPGGPPPFETVSEYVRAAVSDAMGRAPEFI